MTTTFETPSAVVVTRHDETCDAVKALEALISRLGSRHGLLLRCNFTVPGRYRPRWIGFADPPVRLSLKADRLFAQALNARGELLLVPLATAFARAGVADLDVAPSAIAGRLLTGEAVFTALRACVAAFRSDDPYLGLFGPFGFDMAFHALGLARQTPRDPDQDDMVLYLPDRIVVSNDADQQYATIVSYEFSIDGRSTEGLPRSVSETSAPRTPRPAPKAQRSYADGVRKAVERCRAGELFEVVLGQTFRRTTSAGPDALFRLLDQVNPSPYEFLANLGGEALVGASPEMFVRVDGLRVESCPISGTVRRGRDAIEDAERLLELLSSSKAAAELTMCTDIDRDDKAALCEPGSIRLLSRRQIETYSHLLHTVDHVEGVLRPDRDAIDAFRAHVWAVTLTGAPRREAISFIEATEETPRRWYGGAIGRLGFDGRLDTGIVLRAMRLAGGAAEITVGATILHSSDPDDEEKETLTKAGALFRTLELAAAGATPSAGATPKVTASTTQTLPVVIFGGEPFTGTLATLFETAGAAPLIRPLDPANVAFERGTVYVVAPDLSDGAFASAQAICARLLAEGHPILGLGHGMAALAEALGGRAHPVDEPRHGDRETIRPVSPNSWLLPGVADAFPVGCYHRLAVASDQLPAGIAPTALAEASEVMAFEHETLPVAGILYRPESLLTRNATLVLGAFLTRAAQM